MWPYIVAAAGGALLNSNRKSQAHQINDAKNRAMPSSQEVALSDSLQALVEQAAKDRASTRNLILAELGLKTVTGPDGKPSIVRLTDEERRAMMSPIEQNRSAASQKYAERAKAAFEGKTELPSFIQKEFDAQKESEDEVRKQLLGDHAGSAAAEQALEQLKKRERNVRFNIQQQDKLGAFAASKGLNNLNTADKAERIGRYGTIPGYTAPTIGSSAGLLNYLQQKRTGEMDSALTSLSLDNQRDMQLLGAGGTAIGIMAGGKRTTPLNTVTSGVTDSGGFFINTPGGR